MFQLTRWRSGLKLGAEARGRCPSKGDGSADGRGSIIGTRGHDRHIMAPGQSNIPNGGQRQLVPGCHLPGRSSELKEISEGGGPIADGIRGH